MRAPIKNIVLFLLGVAYFNLAEAAIAQTPAPDKMRVHYIDVDQGNAALLEFPCGAVLIDVGGRGEAASMHLLAYLKSFFSRRPDLHRRFDAVIITHTHVDHNVNLKRAIDGRYKVGSYIHNGRLNGSGELDAAWMKGYLSTTNPPIAPAAVSERAVEARQKGGLTSATIDPIACPGVDPDIRVFSGGRSSRPAGWTAKAFKNGNNHSLVVRVDFGRASFLFPGDLENAGIIDLLSRYDGTDRLDADVLLVSHHGADNGTTRPFLNVVSPKIAVISMGPDDVRGEWTAYAYGHPRKSTVSAVYDAVTQTRPPKQISVASGQYKFEPFTMDHAIYATGWDGDVVVTAGIDGELSVSTTR